MFVSDWYWFFFCSDTFFDVLRRNKNRCGFIVVFKGAYNQIKIARFIFVKAVQSAHHRIDVSPVVALFIAELKKTELSTWSL
jgi:hypothetical protein